MEPSPSFIRTIVDPDFQYLPLPTTFFVDEFNGQYPTNTKLITKNRKSWKVRLSIRGKAICFDKGWAKFVQDNKLGHGYNVIFRVNRNTWKFYVTIFTPGGRECCVPANLQHNADMLIGVPPIQYNAPRKENTRDGRECFVPAPIQHNADMLIGVPAPIQHNAAHKENSPDGHGYCVPAPAPIQQNADMLVGVPAPARIEHNAARNENTRAPFKVDIKRERHESNTSAEHGSGNPNERQRNTCSQHVGPTFEKDKFRPNYLTLPKAFVRDNGMETQGKRIITLVNEVGKEWHVNCIPSKDGRFNLTRGYTQFRKDNKLENGKRIMFRGEDGNPNVLYFNIQRVDSLGFAPGPYHPFWLQNSSGWLDE